MAKSIAEMACCCPARGGFSGDGARKGRRLQGMRHLHIRLSGENSGIFRGWHARGVHYRIEFFESMILQDKLKLIRANPKIGRFIAKNTLTLTLNFPI